MNCDREICSYTFRKRSTLREDVFSFVQKVSEKQKIQVGILTLIFRLEVQGLVDHFDKS